METDLVYWSFGEGVINRIGVQASFDEGAGKKW